MIALAGPLHLLALVLVVSGIGKLVSPRSAARAMRDAQLPLPRLGHPSTGTALGAAEVGVGMTALAVPSWWAAAALGLTYLGFAGFVVRLRSRDSDAGCGCFGASTTPPGVAHLVVDLVAAVAAFAVAVVGVPDIVDVFDRGLAISGPYVALLAIGSALVLTGPGLTTEIARARSGDLPRPFRSSGPGTMA